MALINRVSRLFKADFHAVLDRIEEPDALVRQAMREMEDDLAQDEQRMKWLTHEQQQLRQQEAELVDVLDDIEEELGVCLDAGKQDLARTLVRRQLESKQRIKRLNSRRQAIDKEAGSLAGRIRENRQQLQNLRQKAEVLLENVASTSAYPDSRSGSSCPDAVIRDEDVEIALIKIMQRREGGAAS